MRTTSDQIGHMYQHAVNGFSATMSDDTMNMVKKKHILVSCLFVYLFVCLFVFVLFLFRLFVCFFKKTATYNKLSSSTLTFKIEMISLLKNIF